MKATFYRKAGNLEEMRDTTEDEVRAALEKIIRPDAPKKGIEKIVKMLTRPERQIAYVITKTVELTENEYDEFADNLLEDSELVKGNMELMYEKNGVFYCLAVTCETREWTILVECEGFDYARYTAKIPNAVFKDNGGAE